MNIAFVGMTHLGLIHAVAFAEKGFTVFAYDSSVELIAELTAGHMPVNEPKLDELVARNKARLKFTDSLSDLQDCDLIYIAYDVPTDADGNSDLSRIQQWVTQVNATIRQDAILVILSQVPPGFTRQIARDTHALFYQVETLVFGQAIDRALYPERYMVGMFDSHQDLPVLYQTVLSAFDCPVVTMKYESAELAKISINMFLVASVTTTNVIAELCEHLGADWDEIAPALRLDKRIGMHAYLTPGLGIAGGNLERDLNTFVKMGQRFDTDVAMVQAWISNSKYRKDWVWHCLQQQGISPAMKIAVLGLAYKPNTHSLKNSPSLLLLEHLKNYDVHVHDPIVRDLNGMQGIVHEQVEETIRGADVVVVMLPCEAYRQLSLEFVLNLMRGRTIIDPFGILRSSKLSDREINYYCLGKPAILNHKEVSYA